MFKGNNLVEFGIASGFLGIISEYFGNIQLSFTVLIILIGIDTITGIAGSLKYNRFSYSGLKKLLIKATTYSITIGTIRLLEIGILRLINTTILSQIIVSYLIITEALSVLRNLNLLGVPIPKSLISQFISNIKIPGFNFTLENSVSLSNYLYEIDDIIHYQIQPIDNQAIKNMLLIKLEISKNVFKQIISVLGENKEEINDLVYFKIISIIEFAQNETLESWRKAAIPQKYITDFNKLHQPKYNNLLINIKKISYSADNTNEKKEKIFSSILVMIYQSIVDGIKCI